MPIESIDPESSMLTGASYDDERQELTVTMSRGKAYTTPGFTAQEWEEFQNSPSRGRWYRENVLSRRR